MKETMFLCLGSAIATSSNSKYPVGEKHAIVVFVLALGTDEAQLGAIDHMESTNLSDVAIEEIAEVETETLNTAEPEVISAYEDAIVDG